jgi:sugar lactone lactonase YvrE
VSAYLVSRFSDGFKPVLAAYDTSTFPTEAFKAAILAEVNAVIVGPNIYDAQRFAGVALSAEAQAMIAANPQGEALVRLNRRLLDEAYPEDIFPNEMDGLVHTYAGNGQEGWSGGDAVAPTAVSFRRPYGLAVPSQERLLITDDLQRRIRGVNGFGGDSNYILTPLGKNLWDDYPARSSKLTLPLAVAVGADGQALIADYGNRRVRSMTPPCDETKPREPYYLYTVAGKGLPREGTPDTPCSNLYPSSYGPAAEGAKAVEADLQPTGVAGAVGGPYYLSEGERGRVWKVDAAGTLHAVNIPGLAYPMGLARAGDGRLFVADRDASRVWVVDVGGTAAAFAGSDTGAEAGSGPALEVKLTNPEAVAIAPDGSVYVAETGGHTVRRVKDGQLTTVAGTGAPGHTPGGPAGATPLDSPRGVAVDADDTLYVADSGNHRIVRVKGDALEAVSGGPGPGFPETDFLSGADVEEWAGSALWNGPAGLAFDGNGNLYVADTNNHKVRVLWKAADARFGPDPAVGPGDVNEDGSLDVNDVILTLQVTVDLVQISERRERIADVSPPGSPGVPPGDGALDVSDAIRIIRRIVGLIPDDEWP